MTRFLKLACLASLFLLACSREKPAGPAQSSALKLPPDLTSKPGNRCTFTPTEKVVKMEQRAFLDSIRSVSSDNRILVFDPRDPAASRLKAGSILFVPGVAMRKVAAVTQHDGHLVVVTQDATLLEAFKDANIHWSSPVDFAEIQRQTRAALDPRSPFDEVLDVIEPKAYAETKLSFSGEDDGWNYTVNATPQPGRLNLEMTVSRQYNGLNVKIDGSGYVQNFQNAVSIEIKDSQLQTLDYQNSGLNGLVNFNWEATKDTAGVEADEQQVKLPSSFTIPLPIGGIPFALEVSEALLIHPAFTGGNEAARGRFRVAYDGTQGFSLKGGNVDPQGQSNADGSIVDQFSLAPIAPVGFVVAACMPRVELKLGTDSVWQTVKQYAPPGLADGLVDALNKTPFGQWIKQKVTDKLKTNAAAYAQVIISTSTIAAGAGALIPCQRAQLVITIMVGANATVLGETKGNVSKDIFRQEKKVVVPPTKACEG